jgi:hypothetical protein
MTKNALRIALLVGIVAVATAYVVMTGPHAPPAGTPATAVTGNYSDDWQSRCGPLTGAAQADCTSRLDAAYGRVAGAPVPPAAEGGSVTGR